MYDAESQYGGIKLRNFTTKGYRGWGWYNRIAPTGSSSVDITIPTISFNKSSFIVGETANISWTASPSGSNLKHYWLVITNTTTGKQYHGASVGTNSFSFKLTESGTIKVDVYAVRQDGSGKSDSKTFSVRVNSALNLGDNFYAYIIKKDSWKHLANENNNLQLALKGNDSYSPRQIWHFIRQTNGSYKIISEYDGQSLDADGRGTANETNVKLYNSYDTDAQKWFIYKNGSGYNIASSYCDKVFDVAGGKDVAGTNVQFYTSNSSCAQIFSIYKITTDGWTYQKPSAPSKPTVSTNVKSKTSGSGKIEMQMSNGRSRALISPAKPVINLSAQAASTIDSSITVTIKFRVVEAGNVPRAEISITPESTLHQLVRDEIRNQISTWRFEPADYAATATFEYKIVKQ